MSDDVGSIFILRAQASWSGELDRPHTHRVNRVDTDSFVHQQGHMVLSIGLLEAEREKSLRGSVVNAIAGVASLEPKVRCNTRRLRILF